MRLLQFVNLTGNVESDSGVDVSMKSVWEVVANSIQNSGNRAKAVRVRFS